MLINLNNQIQHQETKAEIKEELTNLGTHGDATPALHETIQAMLKVLNSAKKEAEQAPPTSSAPSNTNGNLTDNLGAMMALLSEVEGLIAQLSQSRGENDATVDTAMLKVAASNVKAAEAAYSKLVNKLEAQANESWWEKFWECLVAAIVSVIACAFGQPELALMVFALTALSVSGGMSDAVKAITKDLVKDGMSEKAAAVMASVIMIVTVAVVTMVLTGGASFMNNIESIAESVADDTEIEMTDASTWGGNATELASDTTESTSPMMRVLNFLNKINPLSKVPKWINLSILATAQAISQTSLVTNAINLGMKEHPCSEQEKDKLEKELTIIVELIMAFISIAAGAGVSQTASFIDESSSIGQLLSKFGSFVSKTEGLMSGLQKGLLVSLTGQGLAEMSLSITQSQIAKAELEVAYSKGISELLNTIMNMVSADSHANTENLNTLLSSDSQSLAGMQQSIDQECTKIAQILAQAG